MEQIVQEMKHSAGLVIKTKSGKYLQCHCTGKPKGAYHTFDIPKGGIEGDEAALGACLRELQEETGLDWTHDKEKIERIVDLGVQDYVRGIKDLHVFFIEVDDDEIDPSELRCQSFFTKAFGDRTVELPEVNGFQFSDDLNFYYKNLQNLILNLSL